MARYLGIDYGQERTGIAISNPEETMAFPVATLCLSSFPSRKALLDAIAAIARENGASAIVLGLPLFEDGSENLACRQIRNVAERLKRRAGLPLHFMPELLSTHQAKEDLETCGLKGKKLRAVLDQQAACRILESFLHQPDRPGSSP